MLNTDETYDNQFAIDNVYGHALALLERHVGRNENSDAPGVHLDLGCGYGRIAEPLIAALGVHYVGVDGAVGGLKSLQARGFEAHQLIINEEASLLESLQKILAGRQLRSLTMLDTLEHLPEGDMVLRVIRELVQISNVPAVISVPNVAHRDIGFRLALGHWDYTRAGLLDHTHTRLFNRSSLTRTLKAAGLCIVNSNDVRRPQSDQFFPETLPSLAGGTTLHKALSALRDGVDDTANINQFVAITLAGPSANRTPYLLAEEQSPPRPLLSVVTRTQGVRAHCLVELLTALAGQTDRDFEVLIVGHKISIEKQLIIERIIADCPDWLRRATRLVREYEGNRSRPLNRGFSEARGQYIAIHDDDDLPFAHWVSTFRELANKEPGTILRAVAARQSIDTVEISGKKGIRATGGFIPYPPTFDMFAQVLDNHSPNNTLAFPRGVFHDLNIRFDEALTTAEDWDFLMRSAFVVGVTCSTEVTSIYHWWEGAHQSSRTDHDEEEWRQNYQVILQKLNSLPILLPPGSANRIRMLLGGPRPIVEGDGGRNELYSNAASILTSTCWGLMAPLRWLSSRQGRPKPLTVRDLGSMTTDQLEAVLRQLRSSSSWRMTRFIHRDRRK